MLEHISPSISDPSHSQLRTCSSSPIEAMLPHMTLLVASTTNKQVCWAPPQVFAHINDIIVSHGAQPWPWPMSFLGARRGHFWVSTRPFQKFNEKSFLTTVSHFGVVFVQREIACRVLMMSRISTRTLFEPHRVIV